MRPLVLLDLLQLVVVEDHAPLRPALLVPVVARGVVVPPARDRGVLVLKKTGRKQPQADHKSQDMQKKHKTNLYAYIL